MPARPDPSGADSGTAGPGRRPRPVPTESTRAPAAGSSTPVEGPRRVPLPVSSVNCTVAATVARWDDLGIEPSALDWGGVLVGALQHRVEGLCLDALRSAGWHELAPPTVWHSLERRALLAEARFLAHYRALQELRDLDEELVASLVLLDGAALVGDYEATSHRMVGDVDLFVDEAHAGRLAARARELGYWEKEGRDGPSWFKDVEGGMPGAGYVGLDVHRSVPAGRAVPARPPDDAAVAHWADNLVPHVLGDVKVLRATAPLELVGLLARLAGRASRWSAWAMEDDVRLIRALDAELVTGRLDGATGGTEVLGHARALTVLPEVALGLAVLAAVRGTLPAGLASLGPWADIAGSATHLLALPDGRVIDAEAPLAERVWWVDKSARARALVGDERRPRDWSSHWRSAGPGDRAGADEVASFVEDLLVVAGLEGA